MWQEEAEDKNSIAYIRDNQCRAINERATACLQNQDTSEECRRAGDDLYVCIAKIKYVFMVVFINSDIKESGSNTVLDLSLKIFS